MKIIVRSSFVLWFAMACSEPEDHTHSDTSLSDITQSDTTPDADADTNPGADTTPDLDCRPGASIDPCYCDKGMYTHNYYCCPSLDSGGIAYYCADIGGEIDYGVWDYVIDENPICPAPDLPLCPWSKDNR